MKKPQNPGRKLLGLAGAGLALVLWQLLRLPCLFRFFTGIPCPGCGMTRAWLAVLKLDLSAAFSWHPMFWCVPLLAVLLVWDGAPFSRKLPNTLLLIGLTVGIVGVYLARLFGFLGGFALI